MTEQVELMVATHGVDVEAVAAAAAACPSVVRLFGGRLGEVATYLPGRRVAGVRVADGIVEVHVVARWVEWLPAVGEEVRSAVCTLVGGRPITVFIDDLADEIAPPERRCGAGVGDPDGR